MRDIERKAYLETKRLEVLNSIKAKCEAFNITDYDYMINYRGGEYLRIGNTYIGCSGNSVSAVVDELLGYIFITQYCHDRSLGAFDKQTKNVIKQYWNTKEEVGL